MIKLDSVTKKFDDKIVLNSISLDITDNKVIGLLGKNGAGKTTLMRVISGFFLPDEGIVSIENNDISINPLDAKKNIGYFPEKCPLYEDMRVDEFLKFRARTKGVLPRYINKRLRQVKEDCDISDCGKFLIKNLSKGYRQRVGLADALVHHPKILILDEPFAGLDPKQIIHLRKIIKALSNDHIILLSSHIMNEIEVLCDEFIMIDKGEIIANEKINENDKKSNFSQNIHVELNLNLKELKNLSTNFPYLKIKDAREIDSDWIAIDLDLDNNKTSVNLLSDLSNKGIKVRVLYIKKPNLENAFIKLMD